MEIREPATRSDHLIPCTYDNKPLWGYQIGLEAMETRKSRASTWIQLMV